MRNNNIKIASWNIEGRLSNLARKGRGNATQILDNIESIQADIMVVLEAHTEENIDNLVAAKQKLIDLGYKIYNVDYDDDLASRTNCYTNRLSMMFLSKYPINNFKTIKLGNLRNCMIANIKINDKIVRFIGIHLDDRLEETRVRQINDLTKEIDKSNMPTVVMGDFNAMHGDDLWPARFLKTKLSKLLSQIIIPSFYKRVIGMAQGKTLYNLENNTNLIDIDNKHKPTTTPKIRDFEFLPSIRLIQIDHIYTSKDIKISNFNVSADGGSDHRAINASILI